VRRRRRAAAHIELGRRGEDAACALLAARGFEVLGRRVRTPFAEVDVVARRAGELWCCEVKSSLDIGALACFEPGNRFHFEARARQEQAARMIAQSIGHRGPLAQCLIELWMCADGRSVARQRSTARRVSRS
jgi:putative endonuclease